MKTKMKKANDNTLMFVRADVARDLSDLMCDVMNAHGCDKATRKIIASALREQADSILAMEVK